jgi:hypothetical protein
MNQVLKEDSSVREKELKTQIEKLRTEKKDLEARLGGVDMTKMKVDIRRTRSRQQDHCIITFTHY